MKKILILLFISILLTSCVSSTDKFNMFNDNEFDATVSGYLVTENEEIFGETQTNGYLEITKFYEDGFKQSMEKAIKEGNTVNKKVNDNYLFNLGCFKDNKIEGLDDETMKAILNSSKENPVSVILSFGERPDIDCACCNLASKIKVK